MARHLIPVEIPDGWEVVDVALQDAKRRTVMGTSGRGTVEVFPFLHIKKTGEAVKHSQRIEIGHCISNDVAVVPDDRVRFVAADGRTMFEVRPSGDSGIEVRGIDTYRVGSVLYDHTLSVEPSATNTIFVRSLEY